MKLFSISSSNHLAQSISEKITIPLSDYELVTFGDSEIKPMVKEDVRGETCVIISSTSNPVNDSYMELFLLVDALKRSAIEKIIAVIPYFGYARQNQQHLPGEPVSAQVMVKFIKAVGIDEVMTVDLHEEQVAGFFDIPVTHISALPLLAKSVVAGLVPAEGKTIIVVSPDQGGVERTRIFRDALSEELTRHPDRFIVEEQTALIEKKRNLEGKHETTVVEITGDVSGKIAVIPDDVIVSAGTICHAAEAIKQAGAQSIYLCATHADFIDGTVDLLKNAPVEKVLVTDTIEIKDEWKFDKLEVVSISEMLSEEIKKLK
jgi:ribose-phosphate pyrophosphokinase